MTNKINIYDIKLESRALSQKSDEELSLKAEKLKKRAKTETLNALLVELFGLVQEISSRKLGLKHFDTQLEAGLFLHEGKIVEMKTGEGKTLVSTLPISLNALSKKGVHVITVNSYLAERDWKWMGKIYNILGLTSTILMPNTLLEKQLSYNSDITYLTSSELVFDYLRDSSARYLKDIAQRPFNFCLIDEIDSILIDESRTPLILSESTVGKNLNDLYLVKSVANALEKGLHFELDKKRKEINLTESGYKTAKNLLGRTTLYDKKSPFILNILSALKANHFFKRNKDYILLKNKIVIVDELTGRIMSDRRWSMGLHEAVEVKENCNLGGGTKTKSSITYQNFFALYPKLAGMTGTAKTAEHEFQDIYGLNVIVLPTVKKMIRKDLPDLVYETELAKWEAVLFQSKQCFEKGQPILIGTATIERSDFLSDLFNSANIPHQILNAKPENVARESEIIAQAGKMHAVTIATNMAGRGTDIVLGGNPIFSAKKKLWELLMPETQAQSNFKEFTQIIKKKNEVKFLENIIKNIPYSTESMKEDLASFYQILSASSYKKWKRENTVVKSLGGLFVLGTEHHEARRIDNQLRGRAGRQGDPGISRFFVSLEDELLQVFGGKKLAHWVEYLGPGKPLESKLITKSLEKAQNKVELYNYDLRKNVFEYDDILSLQRKQFFKARSEMLINNLYEDLLLRSSENLLDINLNHLQRDKNLAALALFYKPKKEQGKVPSYKEVWVSNDLRLGNANFYQKSLLKSARAADTLSILDFYWSEHIKKMAYIRETIHLRSYGQQNPLTEHNAEALKQLKVVLEEIRLSMIYFFLRSPINY